MKTKIVVATGLTLLLGTGLYASNHEEMKNSSYGMQKDGKHMMKNKSKHMNKRGHRGFMQIFKKLNLTDEQKSKIIQIKKDLMKNRVHPNVAFTKTSFDKAKFIEIMKQKRENMIESKAEMIDRVYKILTPQQKEQFKTLIDKRVMMMGKKG